MSTTRQIDVVFFDIGNTLVERDAAGKYAAYPSSAPLLKGLREVVGVRIGIITTLGPTLTNADGMRILKEVGLDGFVDPNGFTSDHDAGVAKPNPAIYLKAALKVGVPPERCLFVGESMLEVLGAMAVGMKALLKPSPPGRELGV